MKPCIVAVHQTPYRLRRAEVSLEEMIYQATRTLLGEAGVELRDVDHVAVASSDGIDGRAISSMVTSASAGAYGRDYSNSSSSGEHALIMTCLRIRAGRSQLALVANWAKPSEAPVPAVDVLALDPFYTRRLQMERTGFLAMQASAYVNRYGVDPAVAARLVARHRAAAAGNPLGLGRPPVTLEEAMASPVVAWPLRELDLPPLADGVVVMLVASEQMAKSYARPYARVDGMGWITDSFWMGDRDATTLPSLAKSAAAAYQQAGFRNPTDKLDLVELSDLTPYHEMMAYEALGFCKPGEGVALAESGQTAAGGTIPVNPSGGLHAAYPEFATGLDRVAEIFRQVTGAAGPHQVHGARVGLAHATAGFGMQANSVFILAGGGENHA